MDFSGISAYSVPGTRTYAADTGTQNSSSTAGNGLDMTDFLQLLAAQFTNQDIMNPTDNTEYISELAQFASIQAMNTLTAYADSQYAASLVGKTVVVAGHDQAGNLVQETGVVGYVDFTSSQGSTLVVNGHAYGLSNVMQVLSDSAAGGSGTDPAGGDASETGDGSSAT